MKIPRCLPGLALAATFSASTLAPGLMLASDHADGPAVAGDQAADLADLYVFPDPNDSSKVIVINTLRGFIVPGEAVNLAVFDPTTRYRFEIENTGDAKPDAFIDVTFNRKSSAAPQTATVVLSGKAFKDIKGTYSGQATAAGLAATPPGGTEYFPSTAQTLTGGPSTDISFFAGEADDPFFFDIPGFARFRKSVLDGAPDTAKLARGRDTFAGYNVMVIAFSLPASALASTAHGVPATTKFGFDVLAQRAKDSGKGGKKADKDDYVTVDREGNPAVNALLVPIELKDAYNTANTQLDAAGKFAPAIVASLTALGTTPANINLLAGIAVAKGDFLRIDLAQPVAFPNGRKPSDDVVATLLTVIAGSPLDDAVPANDVPFSANFPHLGLPHQPRDPNPDPVLNVDDSTRN